MTALIVPDVRLCASWAETVRDFGTETMHGSGDWHFPGGWRDLRESGCQAVVDWLRQAAEPVEPLPGGLVPSDYYWITDGDPESLVGFLALRHRLNDWLLEQGGHIGYSVRPSRRREGHASRALALAVRRAGELGLDRVLVTCDDDNEASRRTIEVNGGVYEDTRGRKLRFWIDTSPHSGPGPGQVV
ncbi:GNAT family N-acetyltransferase [Nocardioides sp. cx-169]|uniref:GNAT family N-acetyltransferase n=1 Tax=Nocardioides sp. cx-169 TaxID=2899080 RepID=UPI001E521751|nr:GNAT family N-acetyltransferase [Nocardioides sp. cx-169]MCD4533456.1 GNAT family N-acetyltransferase [Nocardioides sp. cx-169]